MNLIDNLFAWSNNKSSELSAGLLRQRRNLILSSLFTLLLFVAGLDVREINFIGTKILINEPENFKKIVLVGHFYFFIRFIQYYLNEKDRPNVLTLLTENYSTKVSSYFTRLTDLKSKKLNLFYKYYSYPEIEVRKNYKDDYIRAGSFRYYGLFNNRVTAIIRLVGEDEKKTLTESKLDFLNSDNESGEWKIIEDPTSGSGAQGGFIEASLDYSKNLLMIFLVFSFIEYVFKQSCFSDYELPILLGFAPLWVWVFI